MYGSNSAIKNFQCLKTAVLWAGWLSVVQALCWMGLTITGIIAYNCILYITSFLSYGSLIRTVFFDLYFHGDCKPSLGDYQNYNATMLQSVETVLDSEDILIWNCVYLAIATCWLISSVVLLLCVSKDNAKLTLGVIYTWAFFMFSICAMDVALGVIFGVDYTRFSDKADTLNFNSLNPGYIDRNGAQLVAATVVSMSLMVISFKGFILWLINFHLLIWLLIHAIRIATDKDSSDTLFMPRKDSNDILATRPPIRAYEEEKVEVQIREQAFSNPAYVPDSRSMDTSINEDAIVRAAHMSRDGSLLEGRFRNIENFQQYPAPKHQNNNYANRQNSETVVVATAGFPVPDYSPQPSPNGLLRNQPYQY